MSSYVVRMILSAEADRLRVFRLAALADAPTAFAQTLEEGNRRPLGYWQMLAARGAKGEQAVTFIGELDGEWAGMVGGLLADDQTAMLVAMWVHPAHRRNRLGLALVRAVQDWARCLDRSRLRLWVTETNDAAIRLYTSAGFAPTEKRQPLPSNDSLYEIELEAGVLPSPA